MESPDRSVPGAQAIARAARLLRLVPSSGVDGASLHDLARAADLSRSTAHRLLSALRAEGLVDRDEDSTL
ncbi:helix-turn-helix domain-containing protein, partial [Brachybacterium paraconglomeratum]|uniref:helix-turn-helix domain-containing protein n=1 Tax=Brachybacterium paraconglomeratum TaxID=173362 RepID=UPI0022AE569D